MSKLASDLFTLAQQVKRDEISSLVVVAIDEAGNVTELARLSAASATRMIGELELTRARLLASILEHEDVSPDVDCQEMMESSPILN